MEIEVSVVAAKIRQLQKAKEEIIASEEFTSIEERTMNLIARELEMAQELVGEEFIEKITNGGTENGEKSLIRRNRKK